jgi:hypothetical protein
MGDSGQKGGVWGRCGEKELVSEGGLLHTDILTSRELLAMISQPSFPRSWHFVRTKAGWSAGIAFLVMTTEGGLYQGSSQLGEKVVSLNHYHSGH